jgi:glycosyltransferase involved in cell wall biosynthesis
VKTNILILVENLPVPFDRRVWMEAMTLQNTGHQVFIICPNSKRHPSLKEKIDGIYIFRYPVLLEGRSSFGTLVEYAWAILAMSGIALALSLRRKFAIVQVCNPPDILFMTTWAPRLLHRAKLIFDQHDINPELWESKGHSMKDLFGRLLLWAEQATYRQASIVISTNESYREIAIKRGRKRIQDVFVVRSAPMRSFAVETLPVTRSSEHANTVVYIGTMGSQEGIDILLHAVKILIAEYDRSGIRLDLIGDGPERRHLEALSAELELSKNVTFHGRVSDDELRRIALRADVAVNPDRPSKMNNLSSMNKIVEYMALGRPIVQFACREGEKTALDASMSVHESDPNSLAKELSDLLANKIQRYNMSVFGLRRFKEVLAWQHQESELLSAYCSALSGQQKKSY